MEGLLLYKLMILYMLDRTDYTMTNSLISGFIVGKDYTSVFNLHESLSELINDEFISPRTQSATRFIIRSQAPARRHSPILRTVCLTPSRKIS